MTVTILKGDCRDVLRTLEPESVHCVVTSPPYFGLRDYGVAGQIGLEPTPDAFVAELVAVFGDVRRVLRDDGTVWLNLGDSYASATKGSGGVGKGTLNCGPELNAWSTEKQKLKEIITLDLRSAGLKQKDLIGIPWRVAFALHADGWYLRQDIIWSKPNPMPERVRDRCTKAHEYLFLLSKSERYYYDQDAILEAAQGGGIFNGSPSYAAGDRNDAGSRNRLAANTRNKRSVWEVTTQPYSEAHFATFPPALIEPCILAGCPKGGTVLDPFGGAGTTALVADRNGRDCILIELNPEYAAMAERRIRGDAGMFAEVTT
jgi:DNA modification methylase